MSNQLQATGAVKVRSLTGVLVGTSGVVSSLNIDGSLGIPQLDVNGKILVSQLPNSVMEYKGTWDASTNTPTLVNGTGNQGDVYLCNVAGTVNFGAGAIAFFVGDQVIYSGSIWQRASGATGTVTSVAISETGDSLNITGSPITTSGTINIGFNGTNLQYINGAGNLTTFPALTGYVPYTGATLDVDLGTFNLTADVITGATGSFTSNGGSNTFAINHSSGAGIALNITKGGSNEGLYINKTSGSGNAATIVGTLEATTLVKTGGTSSQFLKADGSVDSSGYVPYTGATTDLNLGVHLLRFTTEASDNASIGTTVSGSSSYFDFNLSDDNNQEEWRFRFTPSGGSVYDAIRIRPVSATASDLLVSGSIGAANFSGSSGGTNTGDVTIGTANGLSLASQVLSLAAASASVTGALTSTDWSSFNSKVSSQWTTSGSDIFYNTGNVSVNTTTSGTGRFFVAADTDSGITIRNTGTADRFQLFVGSTGGATYTADNAIIKGTNTAIDFYNGSTATKKVTIPNSGNYLEVYGDAYVQSYVKIGNGSGNYTALTTIASGTKIVTFPNATGTVALTSDIPSLTGYVPYTGATTNLDLGANGLYANNLTITKISTSATIDFPNTGTMNDPAFIRHTESPDNTAVMSFSVGDNDATNDYFVFGNASSGFVERFKLTATGVVTIGTWNGSAIADAYISSAATWNGKVSSVSATSPVLSSGGTTPTISIPAATTSVSGYLTSTDWTTFNNKGTFSLPSLTSGSVLFSNGSTIAQDNANFFWDDTNNRLGIGNAAPSHPLDVTGIIKGSTSIYATSDLYIGDTTGSATGRLIITDSSNQGINIRRNNVVSERFKLFVGNGTTYTQDNAIILGTNTDIDFYTGASPVKRLTIGNTGTATFSGALTVSNGDAKFYSSGTSLWWGASATDYGQLNWNTGEAIIAATTGNQLTFRTNGVSSATNRMVINTAGNVIIGGSTAGTALNTSLTVNNPTAANYSGLIVMTANVERGYYAATSTGLEMGVLGSGIFATWVNGAERMRITSAGLVGIGTSSPYSVLSIKTATTGNQKLFSVGEPTYEPSNYGLVLRGDNNFGNFSFYGVNATVETTNPILTMMRSSGNVGIGMTNPSYKLHIPQGNDLFLSNLYIAGTANNPILGSGATGGSFYIQGGGAGEGKIYVQGAAAGGNGYIQMYTQGNSRFIISSAGNVGLSRSPTSNTLEVNGDASKSTAGVWAANSDINIKTDINTIDGALDRINKVRLVAFKYKDAYKENNRGIKDIYYHNVIAQEFQEIYPDYVYDSGDLFEEHKVLQVDTNPMYVDSVSAIQELSKMVIDLQNQINELKNK